MVPTWAVFPGYFGYPIAPPFSSVIPQQYEAQPVFAYSVYTAPTATAAVATAPLAKSIYTTPDDIYRGYSFQAEYEGGGKSEVVFVTGPQASQLLRKSVELFRTIVPTEAEQPTGRSLSSNNTNTSTPASPSTSGEPLTSYHHVQLYPAHTSPFIGYAPPLQNLLSSFAYSVTNEIASSVHDASVNGEEAQESMIYGDILISPAPDKSTDKKPNATTSAPQTTVQTPPEETSTTTATTTTTTTSTTITSSNATTTSSPESSKSSKTLAEETNEVSDLNTTTHAYDEIMETTSA
jgi:hypothetical protein